jgi:hypothetical protein
VRVVTRLGVTVGEGCGGRRQDPGRMSGRARSLSGAGGTRKREAGLPTSRAAGEARTVQQLAHRLAFDTAEDTLCTVHRRRRKEELY